LGTDPNAFLCIFYIHKSRLSNCRPIFEIAETSFTHIADDVMCFECYLTFTGLGTPHDCAGPGIVGKISDFRLVQ